MVKCEISFETVLSVFALLQQRVEEKSWEPPIYYYYYLNFFLCIYTLILHERASFSSHIFFYLFSFLLSFIIFVYYVLIFFVGREENKKRPLSNLEKCSSPIPMGAAVKQHLNSQEVFLQTRFTGVFVATSKKRHKMMQTKIMSHVA